MFKEVKMDKDQLKKFLAGLCMASLLDVPSAGYAVCALHAEGCLASAYSSGLDVFKHKDPYGFL